MDLETTLVEREESGWRALVEGTARELYQDLLSPDAVVVGPDGVASGAMALDRISSDRWAWFRLRAPRLVRLGDDAVALHYRIIARRDFDTEHQALVTSVYVRDGDRWVLALRQQTPV